MRFFCVYNSNQCSIVIEHYYHLDHQHHHKAQIYPLNNNNKKKDNKDLCQLSSFFCCCFHSFCSSSSSSLSIFIKARWPPGWMDGWLSGPVRPSFKVHWFIFTCYCWFTVGVVLFSIRHQYLYTLDAEVVVVFLFLSLFLFSFLFILIHFFLLSPSSFAAVNELLNSCLLFWFGRMIGWLVG